MGMETIYFWVFLAERRLSKIQVFRLVKAFLRSGNPQNLRFDIPNFPNDMKCFSSSD